MVLWLLALPMAFVTGRPLIIAEEVRICDVDSDCLSTDGMLVMDGSWNTITEEQATAKLCGQWGISSANDCPFCPEVSNGWGEFYFSRQWARKAAKSCGHSGCDCRSNFKAPTFDVLCRDNLCERVLKIADPLSCDATVDALAKCVLTTQAAVDAVQNGQDVPACPPTEDQSVQFVSANSLLIPETAWCGTYDKALNRSAVCLESTCGIGSGNHCTSPTGASPRKEYCFMCRCTCRDHECEWSCDDPPAVRGPHCRRCNFCGDDGQLTVLGGGSSCVYFNGTSGKCSPKPNRDSDPATFDAADPSLQLSEALLMVAIGFWFY